MNINLAFGLNPRSAIAMDSNFLRIRFHDGTGTTAAYTKRIGGVTSAGTFNITGTTGIWTEAGYIKPVGDNAIVISDGSLNDIVNPSAAGGILVLARFKFATHIGTSSTTNCLLCVGSDGAAGGWLLRINVATNTSLALFAGASDGAATQAQKSISTLTNTVIPICAYLDMPTRTVNLSHDGNWSGAASAVFGGTTVPKIPVSAFGFTVLAKHDSVVTPSGYLNDSGGNIGGSVSDILIINDASHSLYALLGDIATEHKNYPIENLWSLDGK